MNVLTESTLVVNTKYIEEVVTDIQMNNEDLDKSLNTIKTLLNSSFNNKIKCVDIICHKNEALSKDFIGMCVYPSNESLEMIAKTLISSKTDTKAMCKLIANKPMDYIIEMDWQLFSNKIYNFKPNEIVAMLLHEIGHITADTDFYCDLLSSYQRAIFEYDEYNKQIKNSYDVKDIYLAMAFVLSSINITKLEKRDYNSVLQKEQIADKFVVDNGYGKALASAMQKITKNFLNKKVSMYNYKKEEELDQEAKVFLEMSKMFNQRRKYVISLLDNEIKVSKITYIKNTLSKIKDKLKNIIIHESVIYDKELLDESFIQGFKRSPLKVSQYDIDELTIQKEMMEDWDDKTILVYKIHKRIAQLQKAKAESNDKELNIIIDNYIKQLNELLKDTMKFKAIQKSYGVFVKYPKGYEG